MIFPFKVALFLGGAFSSLMVCAQTSQQPLSIASVPHLQECASHPEWTSLVRTRVSAAREMLAARVHKSDTYKALAEPEIKTDLVNKIVLILGLNSSISAMRTDYDDILSKVDGRYIGQISAMQRVYIYEASELTRRLQANESIPYLRYDSAGGIQVTWSFPEAKRQRDFYDIPVIFVIPADAKSVDPIIEAQTGAAVRSIDDFLMRLRIQTVYDLVFPLVDKTLRESVPGIPHWFARGLSRFTALTMVDYLLGHGDFQIAVKERIGFPASPEALPPGALDLEKWHGTQSSPAIEAAYLAEAYELIREVSKKNKNATWIAKLIALQKNLLNNPKLLSTGISRP
jgi:hypothetical protein